MINLFLAQIMIYFTDLQASLRILKFEQKSLQVAESNEVIILKVKFLECTKKHVSASSEDHEMLLNIMRKGETLSQGTVFRLRPS